MQVTGRDGVARVIYVTMKGRRSHLLRNLLHCHHNCDVPHGATNVTEFRWIVSILCCQACRRVRRWPTSPAGSMPPSSRQRRPHPISAIDSTNRTSSACREMECFW